MSRTATLARTVEGLRPGVDASASLDLDPYSLPRCRRLIQNLLEEPHESFGRKDLALLNLLCAPTLAGTEGLNIAKCLHTLDALADHVARCTERNRHRFPSDPDWGAAGTNCEPMWRMALLVTVLKRDFGVAYHPEVLRDLQRGGDGSAARTDSKLTFLHGLLGDDPSHRWGTCANIPVLVAAVARRLGYPVGLAVAGWHVYCRWEFAPGSLAFNIETSNPAGMTVLPDEHYRQKIRPRFPGEERSPFYCRTLHPAEEFGLFLQFRHEHLFFAAATAKACCGVPAPCSLRRATRRFGCTPMPTSPTRSFTGTASGTPTALSRATLENSGATQGNWSRRTNGACC